MLRSEGVWHYGIAILDGDDEIAVLLQQLLYLKFAAAKHRGPFRRGEEYRPPIRSPSRTGCLFRRERFPAHPSHSDDKEAHDIFAGLRMIWEGAWVMVGSPERLHRRASW